MLEIILKQTNVGYTWFLQATNNIYCEVVINYIYLQHAPQICGDYLLSKMDSQNAISFRNFASSMGDARVLAKVDAYIQDHLLEVSEQDDFLKLPRLKVKIWLA